MNNKKKSKEAKIFLQKLKTLEIAERNSFTKLYLEMCDYKYTLDFLRWRRLVNEEVGYFVDLLGIKIEINRG
jgi:hypothetical protein